MTKLTQNLFKISSIFIAFLMLITVFVQTPKVLAQSFDPSNVLNNQTIYDLPEKLNSAQKIQTFLEKEGSVLANKKFNVSLSTETVCRDSDPCRQADRYAHSENFKDLPAGFNTRQNLEPYWDKDLSTAEIVWLLSQTSAGSGCSVDYQGEVCLDVEKNPINPAFVLALIQKESGLISGACAQKNADENKNCRQSIEFRTDRATGYICFETSERAKSCYDQNPFWTSFKGFFRQVYHGLRSLRLREKTCELGGKFSFKNSRGDHKVGNTLKFSGQDVLLETPITCALYIYTPHISAQKLYYTIFENWGFLREGDEQVGKISPLSKKATQTAPENYKPSKLNSFEKSYQLN